MVDDKPWSVERDEWDIVWNGGELLQPRLTKPNLLWQTADIRRYNMKAKPAVRVDNNVKKEEVG